MSKEFMKKADVIIACILGACLVALLLVFTYINLFHYTAFMEADVASDALLTTVLYDNGYVQPKTWVASAEICVISAPNLAAFIYPLTGGNMNLSMGIACSFMAFILAVVMFLYFRQLKFSLTEAIIPGLLAFALCTSMIEAEKMFVLYAAYYVSHYITLFLILMAYNYLLKEGKAAILVCIATCCLAFVNGLQGMHGILFCYAPLIGVEVIRQFFLFVKNKKGSDYLVSAWTIVLAGVSYFATRLNGSFNMSTETDFSEAPKRFIEEIWPLLVKLSGFNNAPLLVILLLIVALIGYGIVIKKLITGTKEESDRLVGSLSVIISLGICILSNAVTDNIPSARYYTMLLFAAGIGCAIFINENKKLISLCVPVLAIIVFALAVKNLYLTNIVGDHHEDKREYQAAKWMMDKGYEYGYSTFEHANYITAMSNNKIKVRAVTNMEEMAGLPWLTDTTWYPPVKNADEPTCYIVSTYMMEEFEKFLEKNNPNIIEIGEVQDYFIYVLDKDYSCWKD